MEKRPFTFDEADYRMRVLLAEEGYEQPNEVRRGPGAHEITMAWDGHEPITMDLHAYEEPVERIEQLMNGGATKTVAEVTARMSKLIFDGGLPRPDAIRPGPENYEVSFIWAEEKVLVIVDRREGASAEDLEPLRAVA